MRKYIIPTFLLILVFLLALFAGNSAIWTYLRQKLEELIGSTGQEEHEP